MGFENVKDWMEAIVDSIEHQQDLVYFNNGIRMFQPQQWVHLDGIELVADIMGIQLQEEYLNEYDKYRYSFEYRGIEFISLRVTRLEGFTGVSV